MPSSEIYLGQIFHGRSGFIEFDVKPIGNQVMINSFFKKLKMFDFNEQHLTLLQ